MGARQNRQPGDKEAQMTSVELTPFLTVKDARGVVEYYKKAFGATETSRQSTPTGQFIIEMSIDGERFYAVDENPAAFNVSPTTLGGTSVRISLIVADPDAVADRAVAAGGKIIFPVGDQPYGMRQGRIADPAGHHWLIGKLLR
jgi:PhnB protein